MLPRPARRSLQRQWKNSLAGVALLLEIYNYKYGRKSGVSSIQKHETHARFPGDEFAVESRTLRIENNEFSARNFERIHKV